MGTHPIFESDFDCLTEKCSLKMLPFVIGTPIVFVAALQLVTPKSSHRNDDLVIIRRTCVTVFFTTLLYATFSHYYLPSMSREHERGDVALHTALIFTLGAIGTLYCGHGSGQK